VAAPDGRRIDHTVGIKRDYPHDFFLIQASILHRSRHSIALSIGRSLPLNSSSLRLPGIPIDFSNQDRQSLRQETLVPDLGLQQPGLNRFVDFGPVLSGEDTGRTAGDFGYPLYSLDCNALIPLYCSKDILFCDFDRKFDLAKPIPALLFFDSTIVLNAAYQDIQGMHHVERIALDRSFHGMGTHRFRIKVAYPVDNVDVHEGSGRIVNYKDLTAQDGQGFPRWIGGFARDDLR